MSKARAIAAVVLARRRMRAVVVHGQQQVGRIEFAPPQVMFTEPPVGPDELGDLRDELLTRIDGLRSEMLDRTRPVPPEASIGVVRDEFLGNIEALRVADDSVLVRAKQAAADLIAPVSTRLDLVAANLDPLHDTVAQARADAAEAKSLAHDGRSAALDAKASADAALIRARMPAPLPPVLPPPQMPDVRGLVDEAVKQAIKRLPRRPSGGGRASSKQQAAWNAGGNVLLTYSTPTQATVGAVAANIAGTSSATFRRVTVTVPTGADTGIYCNPAGTATAAHQLIQPGGGAVFETGQAISAIRAGASDVTAYVTVGTKA